jgi:hypothetical protein
VNVLLEDIISWNSPEPEVKIVVDRDPVKTSFEVEAVGCQNASVGERSALEGSKRESGGRRSGSENVGLINKMEAKPFVVQKCGILSQSSFVRTFRGKFFGLVFGSHSFHRRQRFLALVCENSLASSVQTGGDMQVSCSLQSELRTGFWS